MHEAIVFTLHANKDPIDGRTVIQKLIYFEQTQIPLTRVEYTPHFYGPFSRDVAAGLAGLYEFSFVDEQIVSRPIFNMYRYELTDSGKNLFDQWKEKNAEHYKTICRIVTCCKNICDLRAHPISYAAKIHHIVTHKLKNNEKVTNEEIQDRAADFGWDIDETDIQEGKELLVKLDLG